MGARGHRLALAGYEEIEREQSPPFFLAGSTKTFLFMHLSREYVPICFAA